MPENNSMLETALALKNAEIERRFLLADDHGPYNFKVLRVTPSKDTPHNAVVEIELDQFPETPEGVTVANRYRKVSVKTWRVDLVEALRAAELPETEPNSRVFVLDSERTEEDVLAALTTAGVVIMSEEVIVNANMDTGVTSIRAKSDSVGFVGSVTVLAQVAEET